MNSNRIWVIGAVLIAAAVVILGWFLGVSPKLAEAATADRVAASVDVQNAVLQDELIALQKQYQEIDVVREQLATLQVSLPPAAELPALILQLNSMASAYGVTITSISTGEPSNYVPPEVPAAPVDPKAAPVAATAPATAPATPSALAIASVTAENFITVPISIAVSGDYGAILNFTQGLQSGDRLFLVQALTASAGQAAGVPDKPTRAAPVGVPYEGQIDGLIYVLLDAVTTSK